MPQKFKVGDKVRILDASKIKGAKSAGLFDGAVTTVANLDGYGDPRLASLNGELPLTLFSSELKYIEKVAEDVAKFKVGDKVRITSGGSPCLRGFEDGDIATITATNVGGHYDYAVSNGKVTGYGDETRFEKVSDKQTKNQRISTLESEVAELKAKVEALEKAQKPKPITIDFSTKVKESAEKLAEQLTQQLTKHIGKPNANEQRKAIIAEAKAFVAKYEGRVIEDGETPKSKQAGDIYVDLYSNPKKRITTAIVRWAYVDGVRDKVFAKCAPDDVFNVHIGKAIALGRALGLDVKRFEQAVKPTEFVNGQIIEVFEVGGNEKRYLIGKAKEVKSQGRIIFHKEGAQLFNGNCPYFNAPVGVYSDAKILDDTEAQY